VGCAGQIVRSASLCVGEGWGGKGTWDGRNVQVRPQFKMMGYESEKEVTRK
jgi:hypothetical protein